MQPAFSGDKGRGGVNLEHTHVLHSLGLDNLLE